MSDDRLLSDYLLGECSEADRRLMESRIKQDPALRRRVHQLTAVTNRLEALPPGAWAALGEQEPEAPSGPRRRWPMPGLARARLLGAVGAIVLFAVGLGVGVLVSGSGSSGSAGRALTLRPLASAPSAATGVAHVVGGNRLKLVVAHLTPNHPGGYYEAWLMSSYR